MAGRLFVYAVHYKLCICYYLQTKDHLLLLPSSPRALVVSARLLLPPCRRRAATRREHGSIIMLASLRLDDICMPAQPPRVPRARRGGLELEAGGEKRRLRHVPLTRQQCHAAPFGRAADRKRK